jgi:hypothetical protein
VWLSLTLVLSMILKTFVVIHFTNVVFTAHILVRIGVVTYKIVVG